MDHIVFASIAVFFASTVQGIIGFGAGLISMSLLSIIWPIKTATAVMNPIGICLSFSLFYAQRNIIQQRLIYPLLIGLPGGIWLGLLILKDLPNFYLKIVLAVTLLITVCYRLSGALVPRRLPKTIGVFVGFCSGIIGASLNTAGPPALIYASLSGWPKNYFRANLSLFFLVSSLISCIGLIYHNLIDLLTLKISLILLPCMFIGSRIGLILGNHLSQLYFHRLTIVFLTLLALRFLSSVI